MKKTSLPYQFVSGILLVLGAIILYHYNEYTLSEETLKSLQSETQNPVDSLYSNK